MELNSEVHCHTIYSHGTSTIEENVIRAREMGLKKIIISEHGPRHFFMRKSKDKIFFKMRQEIDYLKEKYPDIEILLGVEANIISLDGELDVSDEMLEIIDVLYFGFHLLMKPKNFKAFYYFQLLPKLNKINEKVDTRAVILALNRYKVDMITHPNSNSKIDLIEVARECEKNGTVLEINNKRLKLDAKEIKMIMDEGIDVKFAAGSDAHCVEDIGNVENAFEIIEESGCFERVLNVCV